MTSHLRATLARLAWPAAAAVALLVLLVAWHGFPRPSTFESNRGATVSSRGGEVPDSAESSWRYGRSDARFTIVEYADLECPFCRSYFTVLKRWIDAHPDVAWQWHHLPLSMHEPAASAEANLVECIGQAKGSAAFWKAVEWVYGHTRGDGQGLPDGLSYPDLTPDARQCVNSERAQVAIRAQVADAARDQITVTPTLRLVDRQSGKTLMLHGPVEGDALLSAIDLLAAGGSDVAPSPPDTPR